MAGHPLRPAIDRRLGGPLPHQQANRTRAAPSAVKPFPKRAYPVLALVSQRYSEPKGTFPRVTHPSAADPEGPARLACVKPAASVRSEPGSNSHVEEIDLADHVVLRRSLTIDQHPTLHSAKHPSVSSRKKTTDRHKSLTPGHKDPAARTNAARVSLPHSNLSKNAPEPQGSSKANRRPPGNPAGQSRRLSEDGSAPGPLPRPAPMNRGIRPPIRPVNRVAAVRSVFSVAGSRRACDALP